MTELDEVTEGKGRMLKTGRVAVLVSLAVLAWSGSAEARDAPPKAAQKAAVSQYRESVPSAEGPVIPGSSEAVTRPLPVRVQHEVATQGGSDAPALVKIATSSSYGAPTRALPKLRLPPDERVVSLPKPSARPKPRREVGTATKAVFSTAGGVVDGGHARLDVLAALILGIGIAGVVGARIRRQTPGS